MESSYGTHEYVREPAVWQANDEHSVKQNGQSGQPYKSEQGKREVNRAARVVSNVPYINLPIPTTSSSSPKPNTHKKRKRKKKSLFSSPDSSLQFHPGIVEVIRENPRKSIPHFSSLPKQQRKWKF